MEQMTLFGELVPIKQEMKRCGMCGKDNPSYKHGESHGKLYGRWRSMMRRCYDSKYKDYPRYGGRGIYVCDEWHDYEKFRDWVYSSGYEEHLTLERVDVNGNYEPANCTWITRESQASNRRNTVWIEYNGEVHNMADWARILGVPVATIKARKRKGWSDEDVLFYKGNKNHVNQYY